MAGPPRAGPAREDARPRGGSGPDGVSRVSEWGSMLRMGREMIAVHPRSVHLHPRLSIVVTGSTCSAKTLFMPTFGVLAASVPLAASVRVPTFGVPDASRHR